MHKARIVSTLYHHAVSHLMLTCLQQMLYVISFIASYDGIDSISAKVCIKLKDISSVFQSWLHAYSHFSLRWSLCKHHGSVRWCLDGRPAPTKIQVMCLNSCSSKIAYSHCLGKVHQTESNTSFFLYSFQNGSKTSIMQNSYGWWKKPWLWSMKNYWEKRIGQNYLVYLLWIEYTMYQWSWRNSLNLIDGRIKARVQYQELHSFLEWLTRSQAALNILHVGIYSFMLVKAVLVQSYLNQN